MVTVTAIYPKTAESTFDMDYYLRKHIPFVKDLLSTAGLEKIELLHGTASLDGTPPQFEVIAQLQFSSVEHVRQSLAQHGREILDDIASFTNVQPALQINETM
jgi:uncharacterized protein (TIGR02118 family)